MRDNYIIRKLIVVSLVVICVLPLMSCSAGNNSVDLADIPEHGTKRNNELIAGYARFKESVVKDTSQIWYWVESGEIGKDTPVNAVFVFDNGNVRIYDEQPYALSTTNFEGFRYETVKLGKLGDYADLSNEEVENKAKENFVKAQEEKINTFQPYLDNNSFENDFRQETEREIKNLLDTSVMYEVEACPFDVVLLTDKTGNEAEYEGILIHNYKGTPTYDSSYGSPRAVYGYEGPADFFVNDYQSDLAEIKDSYYIGYEVQGYSFGAHTMPTRQESLNAGYFITRCYPDAFPMLDTPDTVGIYVDPELDEHKNITSAINK